MGDRARRPVRDRARRRDRQAALGHAHRQVKHEPTSSAARAARRRSTATCCTSIDTDGDVVCLETATGKERWRKSMPTRFRRPDDVAAGAGPSRRSSTAIASSSRRAGRAPAMVALDKTDRQGDLARGDSALGSSGADGAGYSSIVISNGGGVKQYVQLMGRGLVSVRASDGGFLWGYNRVANDIANISTPVVKDNYVFALDELRHRIGAARARARGQRPRARRRRSTSSTPARLQNHHGGVRARRRLPLRRPRPEPRVSQFALELATGKMLWPRTRGAGNGSAAVTAADGHALFPLSERRDGAGRGDARRRTAERSIVPDSQRRRSASWSHPGHRRRAAVSCANRTRCTSTT